MARVKTVSLKYGRKINLGDWNSGEAEVVIWAEIDPDEDVNEVMHNLWEMARQNVRHMAVPLKTGQEVPLEQDYLGYPHIPSLASSPRFIGDGEEVTDQQQ